MDFLIMGHKKEPIVENSLNKRQLQETLRQMGIPCLPDSSKEDLIKSLKLASQNQWMKLGKNNKVLRKKKDTRKNAEPNPPEFEGPKNIQATDKNQKTVDTPGRKPQARAGNYQKSMEGKTEQRQPEPNPAPISETRQKIVPSIQYMEACAVQRANGVCELCDVPAAEAKDTLKPCVFIDLPEGKPQSSKDIAVLCPDCFTRVVSNRFPKDIKVLKRKARRKRIANVEVVIRSRS